MTLRKPAKIAAAVLLAAVFVTAAWIGIERFREARDDRAYDAQLERIVSLMELPAEGDVQARFDRIRSFVNDHTRHKIDAAFYALVGDKNGIAERVIAHAEGKTDDRVHMECASRTNLMSRVMRKLGYETRVVAIFDTQNGLRSHSFLDVKNPKTGQWESQDADYDLYWTSRSRRERVSVADAAEDIDDLLPCSRERCGWDLVSRENIKVQKLPPYFDIVNVTRKEEDESYALYTSRADLKAMHEIKGAKGGFCDIFAKRCRDGFRPFAANAGNAALP